MFHVRTASHKPTTNQLSNKAHQIILWLFQPTYFRKSGVLQSIVGPLRGSMPVCLHVHVTLSRQKCIREVRFNHQLVLPRSSACVVVYAHVFKQHEYIHHFNPFMGFKKMAARLHAAHMYTRAKTIP